MIAQRSFVYRLSLRPPRFWETCALAVAYVACCGSSSFCYSPHTHTSTSYKVLVSPSHHSVSSIIIEDPRERHSIRQISQKTNTTKRKPRLSLVSMWIHSKKESNHVLAFVLWLQVLVFLKWDFSVAVVPHDMQLSISSQVQSTIILSVPGKM